MNNGLFLPLEVLKREYVGKLCLAAEVAARGMPVFIGHKRRVIDVALQAREPGILFYKDAAKDLPFALKLKDNGFGLVVQDEEAGIVFNDYSDFYKTRQSLDNIPNLDRFFCWGWDDYEFLSERFCGKNHCNLVNTGSVKTMLWGSYGRSYFKEEISRIKRRYGKFILFSTNFKLGNSYLPEDDLLVLRNRGAVITGIYEDGRDKEKRLMAFVIEAAKHIANQTDYKVVIRPHPVEDIANWKQSTKGMKNVGIEPNGDLTPWMLAARGVFQNACTSGIQAAVSNVPVFAYGEKPGDLDDIRSIPNKIGVNVIGMEQLLESVVSLGEYQNKVDESRRNSLLERKLKSAGTLEPVLDTANAILEVSGPPNRTGNKNLGRNTVVYDLKELYRMSRFRKRDMSMILDQAKRPTIRKRRLRKDLQRFIEFLGHKVELEVHRVAPNTYRINQRWH